MARVLVIDDDQVILDLYREILIDEGHTVEVRDHATVTLPEMEQINPDVIILDYYFGKEPAGWTLLQALKMYRPTAQIPMVVCTAAAKTMQEMEPYLQQKGIQLVLKPFELDELLLKLNAALASQEQAPSG